MIMRLALSSDNGFLGFLDLGLGFDMLLPSLKDQGSGWIEVCWVVACAFVLILKMWVFMFGL